MDGQDLIRWIFVSGWLRQSIEGGCPATRRRRNLGWASTRRSSGCGASERPAALRRARWAGTSRRRLRGSTVTGCWSGTKARDFTLRGLVAELAERGLKVDYRSVWEFVHAEKSELQKKPSSPANATVLTSPAGARNGRSIRARSILSAWSSSTRPGPRPTWRRCGAGRRAAPGSQPRSRTAIGRPRPSWPRCATIGSRHHGFSTARSTARASAIYVEKVLAPDPAAR